MTAEYEFWPRWKPLPPGYEKADTGHTERALLLRRKPKAERKPRAKADKAEV